MITEVEYTSGRKGDFYLPDTSLPPGGYASVLLIHGGAWSSMDRSAMAGAAQMLCQAGFVVFNIDYRLAPEHPWPCGINDCRAALEYLTTRGRERFNLAPDRIFVAGASSGGHYALITGFSAPKGSVAGIISLSGIDDVFPDFDLFPGRYRNLLGYTPAPEELKKINPSEYFYEGAPPVLCTHFLRDTVVPLESCQKFAETLRQNKGHITLYLYDFNRDNEGHALWIPGSSPRQLYSDLEQTILSFCRNILH